MITGASMSSASGNTTLPYAARLTLGSGNRATTALTSGSSSPMNSQLAASGGHARPAPAVGGGGAGAESLITTRVRERNEVREHPPIDLRGRPDLAFI